MTGRRVLIPTLLDTRRRHLASGLGTHLNCLNICCGHAPSRFLHGVDRSSHSALLERLQGSCQQVILDCFTGSPGLGRGVSTFIARTFVTSVSISCVIRVRVSLVSRFSGRLGLRNHDRRVLLSCHLALVSIVTRLYRVCHHSIPHRP